MPSKNTICLWFDRDAVDAANFYAKTFPDSAVGTVYRAPGDYPDGKQGDVLTVEFTVAGIPCIGLNGGPHFKHNEAFSFQIATDDQAETDRLWNADRRQWRPGKRVRLVQGPVGTVVADHPARPHRCDRRPRSRGGQARVRRDDDHEEDRHRQDRGGTAGLKPRAHRSRHQSPGIWGGCSSTRRADFLRIRMLSISTPTEKAIAKYT